jgi:rubrerythrin
MSDLNTVEEILDYAIEMEQAAVDLYTRIAEQASSENARQVFLSFAAEERGHKAKLEAVKAGRDFATAAQPVMDLKIADYANPVQLSDNPTYGDILLFAMQQEKQAFRMYSDLAARAESEEFKNLLLALAQEEAKHKLRFELEYDEHYLTEN